MTNFQQIPYKYNFGTIEKSKTKSADISYRNRYLLPTTTTVNLPNNGFAKADATNNLDNQYTKLIDNMEIVYDMYEHRNEVTGRLLDTIIVYKDAISGHVKSAYIDATGLGDIQTVTTSAINSAKITANGYGHGLDGFVCVVGIGNKIYGYTKSDYGDSWVSEGDITPASVSSIDRFIGRGIAQTTRDYDETNVIGWPYFAYAITDTSSNNTFMAVVYNASAHTFQSSIATYKIGGGVVTGDFVFFGLPSHLESSPSFVVVDSSGYARPVAPTLQVIDNIKVKRAITGSGIVYNAHTTDDDYPVFEALHKTGDNFKVLRASFPKYRMAQSGYDEYCIDSDCQFDGAVSVGAYAHVQCIGKLTLEFGYYSGATWTSLSTHTVGTADEYWEGDVVDGTTQLGTHVRVYGNTTSDPFAHAEILISYSNGTDWIDLFYYRDNEIVRPVTVTRTHTATSVNSGKLPSYNTTAHNVDVEATATIDYLTVNNDGCVVARDTTNKDTILFKYGQEGLTPHTGEDDISRVGDNILGVSGNGGQMVLFPSGSYYAFMIHYPGSSDNKVFVTYLNSEFERTDGVGTMAIQASSLTLGFHTLTLTDNTYSGTIGVLQMFIVAELSDTVLPFGLIQLGKQHRDYARSDGSTTASIEYYSKSGTGDTYSYDETTCSFTQDSNGEYYKHTGTAYSEQDYSWFDAYVETSNIVFDPTFRSQIVEDTASQVFITEMISMHPSIVKWATDSNYITNDYDGYERNGVVEETASMANSEVFVGGSKQVVIHSVEVDSRIGSSVRLRVQAGRYDLDGNEVDDDFRVFFIQLDTAYMLGLGDDNAKG